MNHKIDENKRKKKLHSQERFSSHYIESCFFFRKTVLVWNKIESKNANLTKSNLTFKSIKFKFRICFGLFSVKILLWQPMKKDHGNNLSLFEGKIVFVTFLFLNFFYTSQKVLDLHLHN